ELWLVRVAWRIDEAFRRLELAAPPQGLTVATTARTTRFCRTQDTTFPAPAWSVPPRRSLCEGRSAPFVTRREALTGFGSILCPPCTPRLAPTLPASTAPRPAVRDDVRPPLSWAGVFRLYDKSEFR